MKFNMAQSDKQSEKSSVENKEKIEEQDNKFQNIVTDEEKQSEDENESSGEKGNDTEEKV